MVVVGGSDYCTCEYIEVRAGGTGVDGWFG